MTAQLRNTLLAAGVLLAAGTARMPVEQALSEDLREKQLLREPLDIATRKKVGQGFWAVSLGGLRTLVATVLNLRAFSQFEAQRWTALAESYDTIAALAPHSPYYWDTGAWHMAYNAASHYKLDADLPPLEARAEWRRWIQRGTAFLEEGTRMNPDSALLWKQLGNLYRDPNRLIDYDKATEAFARAIETGRAPGYVHRFHAYAAARSDEYADQAPSLVRELHRRRENRTPTMNSLRFALESRADPGRDPLALAGELFPSPRHAQRQLTDYYVDIRNHFPMDGVAPALRALEEHLGVPEDQSAFELRREIERRPTD